MLKYIILSLFYFSIFNNAFSKESEDRLCYKRGFEIILPYQEGIDLIKNKFKYDENITKKELKIFKKKFEQNFFGLNLYKSAGCSTSRLEEYLNCLVETDGKNCKIYYTQMRLVD